MKTLLITIFLAITSITLNAQINAKRLQKNIRATNKPTIFKPNFPKMDATIKEIIDGANEGTYKITMASLTLGKEAGYGDRYVGSTSTPSTTYNQYIPLTKSDDLTAKVKFIDKKSKSFSFITIYTTSLGGQYVKIQHKNSTPHKPLHNIKITKKGNHRYIITADFNNHDGSITNYIFNVFRYVIQ